MLPIINKNKTALLSNHPLIKQSIVLEYDDFSCAFVALSHSGQKNTLAELEQLIETEIVCLDCLPLDVQGHINISRLTESMYIENRAELKKKIQNSGVPFKNFSLTRKFVNTSSLPAVSSDLNLGSNKPTNLLDTTRTSVTHGHSTVEPSPSPHTLVEALIQTAKNFPDNAIHCIDANTAENVLTYEKLWLNAQKISCYLNQNQLRPQQNIILAFDDYYPFFQCLWGSVLNNNPFLSIFLNQTYASINAASEKFHNAWLLLNQPPILTSKTNQKYFTQLNKLYPASEFQLLFYEDACSQQNSATHYLVDEINPPDTLFYQLTSGSTGIPKCIIETHKNVIQHIKRSAQSNLYSDKDISLNWIMFDHVVPIITYHLRDIVLGCTQIHVATPLILSQPMKWLDYIHKYQVTLTWAPNFGYQLLLDAIKAHDGQIADISCIRYFMNAGEQVTPQVMRSFASFLQKHHIPAHTIQPAFGMAEVATCMTYNNQFHPSESILKFKRSSFKNTVDSNTKDTKHSADIEFVNLGAPIAGCSIRIVDTNQTVLPELMIGELQIKGDMLSAGYYKNDEANKAFHKDGWFSTGDLGFIRQSHLYITGREKETIIIRGQNFFCYEIEATLHAIRGVKSTYCAVTSFFDSHKATEELLVFFVYDESVKSYNDELMTQIRRVIFNNFALNAAYIIDIPLQHFPKTSSGKIQRSLLKQQFIEGEFYWKTPETTANIAPIYATNTWLPKQRQTDDNYDHTAVFLTNVLTAPDVSNDKLATPEATLAFEADNLIPLNNFSVCIIPDLYFLDTQDASFSADHVLSLSRFFKKIASSTLNLSHIVILSKNVFKITDDEQNQGYQQGWLLGFINSIKKELKLPEIILLDLEGLNIDGDRKLIASELKSGCKDDVVAFRQSTRYIMALLNDDLTNHAPTHSENTFLENEWYLIVGGSGGIGVALSKHLINQYAVNLVITGAKHRDVTELEKLFDNDPKYLSRIHYLQCDVQKNDLNAVFVDYQSKFKGILYLVGTSQQISISQFTTETIHKHLCNKSAGLEKVFDYFCLSSNPPKLIVFSSIVSILGPTQFSLYAAANSLCDTVCEYLTAKHQVFIQNIRWCPWNKIGMSKGFDYKFLLKHMGFQALDLNDCLTVFDELVCHGINNIYVGMNHSINQIPENNLFYDYFEIQPLSKKKNYPIHTLAQINNINLYDQNHKPIKLLLKPPEVVIEQNNIDNDVTQIYLYDIWSKHLKIKTFDPDLHFFELGGDSLTAIQIVMDIRLHFGIFMTVHDFLVCENFASLLTALKKKNIHRPKPKSKKLSASYPLSYDQQRLWFQINHCPAETYNVFKLYQISGPLHITVFEQAIEKLLQHFPMLKTRFFSEGQQIYQKIHPYTAKDVCSFNNICSESTALDAIQNLVEKKYDLLSKIPLIALALYPIAESRYFLMLNLHHLICDEWSIKLIASTLSKLYNAGLKGTDPSLEQEETSFCEFSDQQNRTTFKPSKAYLKQINHSYELNLPYLHKPQHHLQGQLLTTSLSKRKFLKLKQLAQENRVTPAILLHGLYSILLHFYSNQAEINIGTPITYREDAALKNTFGFLLNIAVIGSQLSYRTINEHIQAIRKNYFAAQLNKDVPFVEVLKHFKDITRSVATTPLFQAMFVYEDFLNTFSMKDLTFKEIIRSNKTAKFHINFMVKFPKKDEPLLALEFYSSYLSPELAKRMLFKMKKFISFYLDNSSANITDFFQLEPYDLKIAQKVNRHRKNIQQWQTLTQIVRQLLTEKSTFTIQAGCQYFDTDTIREDIIKYASFVTQMKPKASTIIAICLPTKYQQTLAILATTSLGYAYLPINYSEPPERIKKIMVQSKEICLFTDKDKAIALNHEHAQQTIIFETEYTPLSQQNYPSKSDQLDTKAYIIFTSGTTGQPKGVVINHRAVFNTLSDMISRFKIHKSDVFLMLSSISFDLSVFDLFASIYLQAKLVLPNETKVFSPDYLLDLVTTQKVTVWNSTPGFIRLLINHLKSHSKPELFSKTIHIKKILLSGDWVPPDLIKDINQFLPRAKIICLGGATEASIWSNYYIVNDMSSEWLSIPYGRALANQKLYVLNIFNDLCPVGVTGNLFIGGYGVAAGYYKNKSLTKSKFITHPKFGVIYDTGDLAKVDDAGVVVLLGRNDDQVKIRGYRVELKEVELALKSLDCVSVVKVLAIGNRDNKHLVAFLILNTENINTQGMAQHLKPLLPTYMIPHFFITVPKFPLTANGKIDYAQLTNLFEDYRQFHQETHIDTKSDANLNKIKHIFQNVLNLKRDIADFENFFELGGDSISASYFISELNTTLNCKISISDLFYAPTPFELRNTIVFDQGDNAPLIKPVKHYIESSPLSNNQLRLVFLEHKIEQPTPIHSMTLYYEIQGPLNSEYFLQACREVFSIHKILHTKIHPDNNNELQQSYETEFHLNHNLFDLATLNTDLSKKKELAQQILLTASKKPFHLATPDKTELTIVKTSEFKFYLLMNFHHIVADGESIKTLFMQISDVYQQLIHNVKPDLQSTVQEQLDYFDYLQWSQQFEQTEAYNQQLAFWRAQTRSLPDAKTQYISNADCLDGKNTCFTIDASTYTQIKENILEHSSSGFIYILTLFKFCLYKLLKNNVSIIGTTVSARPKEFESSVGFFANTLPVITHITENDTFSSLHKKVKQTILQVLDNQFVSFEKIVGMMPQQRNVDTNPLFQIAFVYLKEMNILKKSPELEVQRLNLHNGTSKFDLTLYVHEGVDYLRFEIEYKSNQYTEPFISSIGTEMKQMMRLETIESTT
ncbi:MAG: amino acid adenylation domain-containing protein [Gammaproteobacteria bacterium]|nr:amino acid adenylation domain-containing protein [Gammaproteobacteria bacterium]